MCGGEKADGGVAQFDDFVLLHFADGDGSRLCEFLLPFLYHHAGQLAGVDGRVADAVDDVGDAADVVQVAVRDEETAYFVATLFQISGVGQNVIDTRRVVLRESETAVEDEYVAAEFNGGHVAPDFFHAAERDDADRVVRGRRNSRAQLFALRRRVMFHA